MAISTAAHPPPGGDASTTRTRSPWYTNLFVQLLVGIVGGITLGWLWPTVGSELKPIGDTFVKLIEMLIAPLIFTVVVTGIAKVGDVKAVGRIGVKALIYFTAVTGFALLFGLVMGNIVKPGAGFDIDPATLADGTEQIAEKTGGGELPGAVEFLMDIVPTSVVGAFADNILLQVLFFAVLFGIALAKYGEHGPPLVLEFVDHLSHIIFMIIGWIMRLAPIGAFGAMAFIIGQYGISTLGSFAKLIACCYLAGALFVLVLALIAKVAVRLNIFTFIRYTKEEFGLALGTASSEAVLPRIMTKLVGAGNSQAATGLVVPTGYSFNLDGAAIYLSISTLFLAQATGHDLSVADQLGALFILLLTSKGMAGVPGSSFLALSATATALGIFPVAAVAVLLGADRIMDSMRVFVNLLGNCVATFVVSNWEGQLDKQKMQDAVNGRLSPGGADPVAQPPVVAEYESRQ